MSKWNKPNEIEKDIKLEGLSEIDLEFYHDQMHIFWKKIEEGIWFDWTFKDVYLIHKEIVIEMLKRGINHIYPINELDNLVFVKDINELNKILTKINKQKI